MFFVDLRDDARIEVDEGGFQHTFSLFKHTKLMCSIHSVKQNKTPSFFDRDTQQLCKLSPHKIET